MSAPLAPELLLELTTRYTEPHRHYHTIDHVADLLMRGRSLDLSEEQVLAIWFHDVIYDAVPDANNEVRSAEFAVKRLRGTRSEESLAIIDGIIRDTEKHVATIDESRIVIDLDLASLALPREAFVRNTDKIVEEWKGVAREAFWRGHAAFAESFLARDRIYLTEWGAPLEAPARENLRYDLDVLCRRGLEAET